MSTNKRKVISWSLILLLALLLTGFFFFRKEAQPLTLETAQPIIGDLAEKVTATGTVQIVDTVAVGTQVSGIIRGIYVDYNSKVKKGELLAEIDPTLLQAQADQTRGSLASAQANVQYQKTNFGRQQQLYETGAISKADYDNAVNTFAAAQATLSSVQAQLRSASQNLAYTKIYSPLDGVVLSRNVSIGQTVASSFSTPTLFVLAKDITKMVVYASVDEADISHVAVGNKASFTVDAYMDEVFQGSVKEMRLQPTVSSNVVTYATLIDADNTAQQLKPGMTATVTIYSRETKNALLIPVKAIRYSPDDKTAQAFHLRPLEHVQSGKGAATVWIKTGQTLTQKLIQTGIDDNTQVEVLNGLGKSDTLVVANPAASTESGGQAGSPFMPKMPGRKKKAS